MRIVSKVLAVPDPPKVRLYRGFPPKLDPDPGARQMMAPPDILLIQQDKDGNGFFLVRYTEAVTRFCRTNALSLPAAE
jgi:hypothetical protein